MQYRRFGRTGLQVSAVGFGCGRVGGLLIDGSDRDRRRAVRKALDGGINWFDTAESYGDGKSEEALGWLLAEVPEKPNVSTKVTLDPRQPDLAGQVVAHAEACLKRLRRDAVTVLQVTQESHADRLRATEPNAGWSPGTSELGDAEFMSASWTGARGTTEGDSWWFDRKTHRLWIYATGTPGVRAALKPLFEHLNLNAPLEAPK